MLTIETHGSWRDMGQQLGEAFRQELGRCIDHFCPWLIADPARYAPAIGFIRELLERHAPELLAESQGIAEGANLPPDQLLGYRFMNDVKQHARQTEQGCCAIWMTTASGTPLLGRNCDLEPDISQEIQLCRLNRPDEGPATISFTYLGFAHGTGLNDYGLATGGASAHTQAAYQDANGLPGCLLQFMLLTRCSDVEAASELLSRHAYLGKPANFMVADAGGACLHYELATGKLPHPVPPPADRGWHCFTNFFVSGEIPIKPNVTYLESAYARWGRIVHQLGGEHKPRTPEGLRELLTEVASPGICNTGQQERSLTAYTMLVDLAERRVHYTPGHPARNPWESLSL